MLFPNCSQLIKNLTLVLKLILTTNKITARKQLLLVIQSLERCVVVESVLSCIMRQYQPRSPERPLLRDVHPAGQVIPVEVYLKRLQQSTCTEMSQPFFEFHLFRNIICRSFSYYGGTNNKLYIKNICILKGKPFTFKISNLDMFTKKT